MSQCCPLRHKTIANYMDMYRALLYLQICVRVHLSMIFGHDGRVLMCEWCSCVNGAPM